MKRVMKESRPGLGTDLMMYSVVGATSFEREVNSHDDYSLVCKEDSLVNAETANRNKLCISQEHRVSANPLRLLVKIHAN